LEPVVQGRAIVLVLGKILDCTLECFRPETLPVLGESMLLKLLVVYLIDPLEKQREHAMAG